MEKIPKKLRSRQGTSIFFGILFFLIASILSIVMLNGAVTAVKSVQSDRQAEQNFLTCSSAAKTLRDAITDIKVTRTQKTIYQGTSSQVQNPVWTVTSRSNATATDNGAVRLGHAYLVSWIQELVDASATAIPGTKTLKIQGPDTEAMQDVEVTITIKKDTEHNVTIGTAQQTYNSYDMFLELASGEGVDSCRMMLELSGGCAGSDSTQMSDNENKKEKHYTTKVEYTWNAERILYGSEAEAQEAGS